MVQKCAPWKHLQMWLAIGLSASSMAFSQTNPARKTIAGSPKLVSTTERLSATPKPSDVLHINFFLKSAHRSEIAAFRASQQDPKSPNFRTRIPPDEFGNRFGASDADIKTVVDFANANGFTVTHVWENHLFIAADAPVARAEKAFQVKIKGYNRPAHLVAQGEPDTLFSPDRELTAPAELADKVEAIFGLDNYLKMHPSIRNNKSAHSSKGVPTSAVLPATSGPAVAATKNSIDYFRTLSEQVQSPNHNSASAAMPPFWHDLVPSEISTFYGLDPFHSSGVNGDGQNIAIISPTKYNFQDNVGVGIRFGLTGWHVHFVDLNGGANNYDGQDEACIDTEVIIGQAPHADIWVFQFPTDFSEFINAYNVIGSNHYKFIQVVSQSWGRREDDMGILEWKVSDAALSVLGAEGISIYASSGDTPAVTNWPSTDPNVTAVGGTDGLVRKADNFFGTDNHWLSEDGWSLSGGGNSVHFPIPSWQSGPGVNNQYSNGHRQVPDVAAAAGSDRSYSIMCGGELLSLAGTSAACPLWAAANLLIDQQINNYYSLTQTHSGSLNPELYWIGTHLNANRATANGAFVFRDATYRNMLVGDHGFPTTDGWDYVTGWGSADFWKLWADYVAYWGYVGAPYDGRHGSVNLTGQLAPLECAGPADIPASTMNVQIDGVNNYFPLPPVAVNQILDNTNILAKRFTPGTHSINQYLTVATPNYTKTTTLSTKFIFVLPDISQISLSPNPTTGGTTVTGTITLNGPAPEAGALINLTNTNIAASVPSSVLVPRGAKSVTFPISTSVFPSAMVGTVEAAYNGFALTTTLRVNPLLPSALSLSPNPAAGGNTVLGKVILNGPAPAGGALVALGNHNSAASVPLSVTVPAAATSVTFPVHTTIVRAQTKGYISSSYNGRAVNSLLAVNVVTPKTVTFNPAALIGGLTSVGTLTLTAPAPTGGLVVTFASSSPSLSVPPTITVPAGAVSTTFKSRTFSVAVITTATVTATLNGGSARGSVKLSPNRIAKFIISPTSVKHGLSATGTVTLAAGAAKDVVVTFTSTGGSTIPAPASITVPAGSSTGTVTIHTSTRFVTTVTATITATAFGTSAGAALTATP